MTDKMLVLTVARY